MFSWGMEVERWLKMGLTKLKFLRQYSLCNCDHLHDTEHWSDNRLCCYTWFQTFSTYIYQSFYIYLRFNSLLIVKGWKKLSFSTQDHNSKKFHRKKKQVRYLFCVVHLQLITLSLRTCISSSDCIKPKLCLYNICVQTLFQTLFDY